MSQELIYTSVPQGLKPGSKGFSTVAVTAGLPTAWIERLESLSGYRPIYPLGDPKAQNNPVNLSHWRITIASKQRSVLSRVSFAGADYSGRSNKLGHHIVVEPNEQAAGGPAWMISKPGVMRTAWTGNPQQMPAGPTLPVGDRASRPAAAWASVLGDAGWAAFLAESFATEPTKPAYLIFSPGTNVPALFEESLGLVPPARRWEVTFSTFFSELPLNLNCAWRAVIAGSPAATEALRMGPRVRLLDLTKPAATAPTGIYADAARAGSGPVIARAMEVGNVPATQRAAIAIAEDPEDSKLGISLAGENALSAASKPLRRGNSRRLNPAVGVVGVTEELPDLSDLSEPIQDGLSPPQVVVYRGVRTTIVAAIAAACVVIGMGVGIAIDRLGILTGRQNAANTPTVMSAVTTPSTQSTATIRPGTVPANIASKEVTQTTQPLVVAQTNLLKQPNDPIQPIAPLAELKKEPSTSKVAATTAGVKQSTDSNWGPLAHSHNANVTDVQLSTLDVNTPIPLDDFKSQISDPNPSDDAKTLTLAWPNNSTVIHFESSQSVELSLESRLKGNSPSLRVVAKYEDLGGNVNELHPIEITLQGTTLVFSWAPDSPKPSPKIIAAVADLLGNSVIILSSKEGKPIARFSFKRDVSILSLDSEHQPCELKGMSADTPICLAASIGSWDVSQKGVQPPALTCVRQGKPEITFALNVFKVSSKLEIECDWFHKFGKLAQRLKDLHADEDSLRSEDDVRFKTVVEGTKYDDAGDGTKADVAKVIKAIKQKTRDKKSLQIEVDHATGDERTRIGNKKDGVSQEIEKEFSKLDKIIEKRQQVVDATALSEFDVNVTLPNGLAVMTIHVKPPSQ